MMEHGRSHHTLRIRDRRRLCGGPVVEGHGVCERDQDQGECDEAPAVVADVVEFEVVGGEVELRGRSEPWGCVSFGFGSRVGVGDWTRCWGRGPRGTYNQRP
jgi:hypothetical protein